MMADGLLLPILITPPPYVANSTFRPPSRRLVPDLEGMAHIETSRLGTKPLSLIRSRWLMSSKRHLDRVLKPPKCLSKACSQLVVSFERFSQRVSYMETCTNATCHEFSRAYPVNASLFTSRNTVYIFAPSAPRMAAAKEGLTAPAGASWPPKLSLDGWEANCIASLPDFLSIGLPPWVALQSAGLPGTSPTFYRPW